jgi:hypothetical protein
VGMAEDDDKINHISHIEISTPAHRRVISPADRGHCRPGRVH